MQGRKEPGANPRKHRAQGGVHPGQDACPLQGTMIFLESVSLGGTGETSCVYSVMCASHHAQCANTTSLWCR
ncbi:hypothetical protein AMELA_G00136040 [Ameiurus melas]|uniref:Uncharacterized protein n=1 Tax=Ameiurus melas TaxID=219545 RepID=A0A7J6ANL6_AMEME|nr:hypothetical protein AMELA_G00136040 [Ameiurus melas]